MADVNFSLDEYIARKSIAVSRPGSRGGGAATRGGGAASRGVGPGAAASRGGRSVQGRLGSRPTTVVPKPLLKTPEPQSYDAREKILEKVRSGDARDKIIFKNRSKMKDARDKIGGKSGRSPADELRRGDVYARMAPQQQEPHPTRPSAPPPMARHAVPLMMAAGEALEEASPRRRTDAQVFGRDNNIIVMAKNDFADGRDRDDDGPFDPRAHGNPVVMIKNDRMRVPEVETTTTTRNRPPIGTVARDRVGSPPRRTVPQDPRRAGLFEYGNKRQPLMETAPTSSSSRSRSPLDTGRMGPRTQQPHYDSGSDDGTDPDPRRKPTIPAKRVAQPVRQAPRPEKQPKRSPEPLTSSKIKNQTMPTKSTSILHGIKPLTSSQIPRETENGDKYSPIQGHRVMVSNLHSIVTQEDVVELFSACGALKRTKMIKPSIAEVVFVKREDAEMAVKKYNNRELDGQPMVCKMLTPAPKPSGTTSESPLLGGRLKPANQTGEGVEATTIHKALFNSASATTSKSTKPVVFTVKI